jgi:hypothetical protein
MPTLFTDLPEPWPLQPGEQPCPASEAAFALVEIAALDVTPEAVELGVRLRQLLAAAAATADQLAAATGPQE